MTLWPDLVPAASAVTSGGLSGVRWVGEFVKKETCRGEGCVDSRNCSRKEKRSYPRNYKEQLVISVSSKFLIDELIEADEVFYIGTAIGISEVGSVTYKDQSLLQLVVITQGDSSSDSCVSECLTGLALAS
ncbi:hypothetical protein V8G54_018907 [Vigna mungo]|uniref:Uncharacterized protein n=1 Tax=Vigna mungo TaxID=3915 RepID=A0AAQ3NA01_VIGMU